MNKLRALALPAVTVTSMLALAACGGGSSSTTKPAATTSSPTASASASSAPTPLTAATALTLVSHAVIGNGDLGAGWKGGLIQGGGGTLSQPTVDGCTEAPSEKLRLARNQTQIVSRSSAVSNEVVGYAPGGAAQALADAKAEAMQCNGKVQTQDGVSYRTTYKILATQSNWGPNALAYEYTITDPTGAHDPETGVGVYIVNGDLLSGIYDWDGTASQDLIFQVADLSATRLAEALADQPRTTASIPVPPGPPLPTDEPSDGTGGGGNSI